MSKADNMIARHKANADVPRHVHLPSARACHPHDQSFMELHLAGAASIMAQVLIRCYSLCAGLTTTSPVINTMRWRSVLNPTLTYRQRAIPNA